MEKNNQRYMIDVSWALIVKIVLLFGGLVLLYFLREAILIILASIIVAAVVDSFSDRIQGLKIPRFLSVTIVYIVVVGVVIGIFALVVPPAVDQLRQISTNLPQIEKVLSEEYEAVRTFSEKYYLEGRLDQMISDFKERQGEVDVFSKVINFFGGAFSVILIFVISFYLSVEESGIKKFLKSITPKRHEERVLTLVEKMQFMLGRWVKGQLLVACIMGVVVGLVLWFAGVKYALALGILAGILEFIPVIGPIIAAILGTIMALTLSIWHGLGVLIFYIVLNQLENHILIPKIMNRAVGLHPVVIIIAMLVGYKLAGVVGILLAVPVSTVLAVLLKDLLEKKGIELSS